MIQPWTLDIPGKYAHLSKITPYLSSWAKLLPSDFIFSFQKNENDDSLVICLVPMMYYKQFGHMLKTSMPISHLLPLCLVEEHPSIFSVENEPPTNVYFNLGERGFIHDRGFQEFIKTTPALEIYG
jgi:hypothetical protein